MALLFMDSFDHYVTADFAEKWTQYVTTFTNPGGAADTSIAAIGARSSGGLRLRTNTSSNTGSGSLNVTLSPTPANATFILGFRFRCVWPFSLQFNGTNSENYQGENSCLLAIRLSAATVCWVRLNPDGTLGFFRGSTLLASTSSPLTQNVFQYIEIKVTLSTTVGTVDIRLNGVSVLALTGQNTGAAGWSEFRFGPMNGALGIGGGSAVKEWDIDDLYVCNGTGAAPWNDFLGDVRVDPRYPTAPGASAAWTPLAGANWAAVDDAAPDDDTTYTSTATVGATDTFVTQDAPVAGATILGVQSCLNLKKMDTGTCTVAPVVRHGTTNYPGVAVSPGTGYGYGLAIAATNPGTGAPWTEAGFNACEFGYSRIT